ncbi:alpha-1,2-fucosyltransferase [Jannaschia pagri]|uniref:Alpha-1,2-fucosyltransferase n=2 Tax=Roseobacteraceae TaxID=2854170 RepID=A0ABQ4NQ97_9RHOB|nr:alpha-1,2-fucosyltransferase [Jannaschia sp. AI_61]GIT96543.1 alpha-1,2-fucosyltransferase [Jannaschia sp. AI_62]
MFQYATARALADRLGVDLALDTRDTTLLGGHAGLQLHRYAIRHVPPETLPPGRKAHPLRYLAWRAFGGQLLRERGLGVNAAVTGASDGTYLHGYFQSERYFADHGNAIRQDLTLLEPLSGESTRWRDRIAETPHAVSLHVRRGDYLSAGNHGTCDAAYYARALSALTDLLGTRPHVFAFSDDPDWVRETLHLDADMSVIGHNGPDAGHEDMELMSVCDHHIIANSTFSWWGAWRNPSRDKIVVAPDVWFADPRQHNPDILPVDWYRV